MTANTFILPAQSTAFHNYVRKLDQSEKWKVSIVPYKRDRSVEQNAVSHGWYGLISRTLKEDTPGAVKRFCKLEYGVPILRADSDEFNDFYHAALENLTYEQRIDAMRFLDVTSLMNTKQMSEYMETIQRVYAGRVDLRFPNEPPIE